MAKIKFENGTTVNFDGEPTEQDIEEISQSILDSSPESRGIVRNTDRTPKETPEEEL